MNTNLPPVLETKLAEFRQRVWAVKLAEGVLAAVFGLALSYLFVFALDRFFETPAWVRLSLLIVGAAGLGLGLPLKWHQWVWRQRRLEDAARLLRHNFPKLGDQLLGLVELARADHAAAGRSDRLVRAAMEQAAAAIKDRDFTHAVPNARHRHWAWAAGGGLAVVLLAFAMVNDAAGNAFARWLMPWRHVKRFTFTRVQTLPARLVVPYAEPFDLPVQLEGNTRSTPDQGTARIGKQPEVTVKLASGAYPFAFPPQKQDAPLSMSVGDVRQTILIAPRARPELSELALEVRLPDYLGYKSEQHIDVHGNAVNVLKGAEAAFEATANHSLASARLDGQTQIVDRDKIATSYQVISKDEDRTFTWKDRDGLAPRDPFVLKVRAVEDEPPKILARRDSPDQVVLDSEVVTFDVNASDDFGVKSVGLEWTGSETEADGKTPVTGEKISSSGGNEAKDVSARATFCATREGVAPQTLAIRAWATDYLPGRQRSHSATFTLQVLNKTDHAIWLTEQFGKWLEAAKESYEREQQLHQSNKELRALSPAELDRPENRRRVSQQASAETSNAARLDGLTHAGRNLVEQATKNDEFDAKRLESWATMLKSLQDIAANRMPSVTDLLKQTAAAPGVKPGGSPANGNNAQPSSQQSQLAKTDSTPTQSAPNVSQGAPLAGTPSAPPPIDPNATPKPAAPSISDREAGYNKPGEAKPADPNAPPVAPGGGKLRLPTTMLAAAPSNKKDDGAAPPPPASPAQEKMEAAITEQKDLLAEFAKVSDQLNDILASLEASTFVKRLKGASRQQMGIASTINKSALDAFGVEKTPVNTAPPIAKRAKDQSEIVRVIQSDLEAYYQRKQDTHFKTILDEMKKTQIVRALAGDGDKVLVNLNGQSLIGSEYWGDTLDRWAEDLVDASNCKSCSSCSGDSLPPEVVLKVMQSLRDEMKLRDQTRETETSKDAVETAKYTADATALSETQSGISTHTQGAVDAILALPEGSAKFGKELRLLGAVINVMDESKDILATPDTGAKAIAAETEAIELLLQAKRQSPKGGGGGGANPGGGGRGSATAAALADLGPGSDAASVVATRQVGQATGRAGKEFPEEFKTGLDAYFNLLEASPAVR